ncbi:UNKNOWN [Stylonychia lemnae]|uniref:Homeobox domain-containing protein n=1 Tax=Stylonychia lemnae TaxID=5949 RepID=A0A077ZYG6_STYLE|nr:UNKNOWN [Stylonychia lemnae]|eukprot:CDW74915.1 UNKNOWN [Stylonychia lemnae]
MFKRSQLSAFIPYAKIPNHTIQLNLPQAQLFFSKLDLPAFDRMPSTKQIQEREEDQLLLSNSNQILQNIPLLQLKTVRKESSNSMSSMLESGLSEDEDINDFTLQSHAYPSTNASSTASPLLSDKELVQNNSIRDKEHFNSTYKKLLKETNIDSKTLLLDFEDLNECVAALLKKSKDENGSGRDIKRRQRKNKDQIKLLENEYKKTQNWTRDYIKKISARLGLRECQVYKWHWDQRKKDGVEMPSQKYL